MGLEFQGVAIAHAGSPAPERSGASSPRRRQADAPPALLRLAAALTRRPFAWPSLVAALGVVACAGGPGIDAASAQAFLPDGPEGHGLVYEKRLDLGIQETSPPVLVSQSDGGDTARTRIVHGIRSRRGEWPTVVSLNILTEGARAKRLCAGTVIDPHWILTAAHCVFTRSRGGLKGLRSVTAFANSNLARAGEARRVKSVVVHPKFAAVPRPGKRSGLVNDIALLELATPTTAPRQKLAARAGRSIFFAPGRAMTVIGWGFTKPRKPEEPEEIGRAHV